MVMDVMVEPVLFVNLKPKIEFKLLDCNIPNARSEALAAPHEYVSPAVAVPVAAVSVVSALAPPSRIDHPSSDEFMSDKSPPVADAVEDEGRLLKF